MSYFWDNIKDRTIVAMLPQCQLNSGKTDAQNSGDLTCWTPNGPVYASMQNMEPGFGYLPDNGGRVNFDGVNDIMHIPQEQLPLSELQHPTLSFVIFGNLRTAGGADQGRHLHTGSGAFV